MKNYRTRITSALSEIPSRYRVIRSDCGVIAYLGDGKASPGQSYAPQILATEQYLLALVSPDLSTEVIGEKFIEACVRNEAPRARAIALKYALRELSESNRFSFVLLDLKATRVFAASTAKCSPIAAGHAPDGTLFLVCNRSPGKAARKWPPRWAQGIAHEAYDRPSHIAECYFGHQVQRLVRSIPTSVSNVSHGPGRGTKKEPVSATHALQEFDQQQQADKLKIARILDTKELKVDNERESRPSSSQILGWCCRKFEAPLTRDDGSANGRTASEETATTRLFHLPAGRFVYGRNNLYPAEFSSFWKSEIPTQARALHGTSNTETAFGTRQTNTRFSPK